MCCLGCGCLILVILLVLILALFGAVSYMGYSQLVSFTSPTPGNVPTSNAGDDVYNSARQKLADFDHDIKNHQAATIQLSADEINALITRDPEVIKHNIHAYVSLTGNAGRIQGSFPTDILSHDYIKDRYLNLDASFEINFDSSTRNVNLSFQSAQLGSHAILGPEVESSQGTRSLVQVYTGYFNLFLNNEIRQSPDGASLLAQAKSIEVKNGELVIETQ